MSPRTQPPTDQVVGADLLLAFNMVKGRDCLWASGFFPTLSPHASFKLAPATSAFPFGYNRHRFAVMAELLAVPASIIALVQAVGLAQGTVNKISGLKKAPRDVSQIADDLRKLHSIVQLLDKYARDIDTPASNEAANTLRTQIADLKSDLNGFLAMVEQHLREGTWATRLAIRTKWLMGLDKRLSQMSDRISAQSGALLLVLSLYSRYVHRQPGIV
jgi:hypothetical protein